MVHTKDKKNLSLMNLFNLSFMLTQHFFFFVFHVLLILVATDLPKLKKMIEWILLPSCCLITCGTGTVSHNGMLLIMTSMDAFEPALFMVYFCRWNCLLDLSLWLSLNNMVLDKMSIGNPSCCINILALYFHNVGNYLLQ